MFFYLFLKVVVLFCFFKAFSHSLILFRVKFRVRVRVRVKVRVKVRLRVRVRVKVRVKVRIRDIYCLFNRKKVCG